MTLGKLSLLLVGFQDPATPIMEAIVDVHNYVMFYLLLVIFFVVTLMANIYNDFHLRQHATDPASVAHRKDVYSVNRVSHSTLLEVVWTLIPVWILVTIAVPSFALLYAMDEVLSPRLIVKVTGNQWYWSYEYSNSNNRFLRDMKYEDWIRMDCYMVPEDGIANGSPRLLTTDGLVVVPANTQIQFLVTASDVLHSWAVPSLGVKVDAVPGRMSQVFAYLRREGLFFGQCSEICGVQHGFMPIAVKAVDPTEFLSYYMYQGYSLDPYKA